MDTLLDRRVAITVVVVWTIYGIVSLATHTFLPVDETRYVTVAWNMWLRGDFLVPWLNDIPYHHKPPLLFWIMHAGWAVTGVNEWWPRIAPGLFGLGATWLTWRISLRLWPDDRKGARLAVILLVGSLWWSLFAAATMFDMLATRHFLEALLSEKAVRKGRADVAVIGMRVDARTRAAGELERFFATFDLPVLTYLRDTQVYVQAAAAGMTLFDLPPSRAERDLEQWQAIIDWVEGGDRAGN